MTNRRPRAEESVGSDEAAPILFVGVRSFLADALQQALAPFGASVELLEVDFGEPDWGTRVAERCMSGAGLQLPLLVSHSEAWQVLRAANTWAWRHTFGPTPAPVSTARGEHPSRPVKPLPLVVSLATSGNSLSDLVAGAPLGRRLSLSDIIELRRPATSREREILARAALRSLALNRHRVTIAADGHPGHERADRVAALRFLQGAYMSGCLDPTAALSALTAVAGTLMPGAVTDELGALFEHDVPAGLWAGRKREAFGALLLVDDQGVWAEALDAVWAQQGLRVTHCSDPRRVGEHIADDTLVIVLDLQFPGEPLGGAGVLRDLAVAPETPPVIGSSIHDLHSLAALLHRWGVFGYVSKRPTADDEGTRDELTYFHQFRDTILLAGHASLAREFRKIWQAMPPPAACSAGEVDREFSLFVEGSANGIERLCQDTLHQIWQHPGGLQGLIVREAMRNLGLLHDKWCEMACSQGFDPDARIGWPPGLRHLQWPYGAYHKVVNVLRNEASHAAAESHEFAWLDFWIMLLAEILRARGLPGCTHRDSADELIETLSRRLWHLLELSGFLATMPPTEDADGGHRGTNAGEVLRRWGEDWRRRHWQSITSEFPPGEVLAGVSGVSPSDRVAIAPYCLRLGPDAPLLYERDLSAFVRSEGLTRALPHLLLLEMASQRVSEAARVMPDSVRQ